MKKKSKGNVTMCVGTSGEKMGDETPDFVCRGCGYHTKNCVCKIQKQAPVVKQAASNSHLMYFT